MSCLDSSTERLLRLHAKLQRVLVAGSLLQARRRERGAWTRPETAAAVPAFLARLEAHFADLERALAASMSGRSDDVVSGRLGQATAPPTDAEIAAAGDAYDVDAEDQAAPLDASRLAALLLLLYRWSRRQRELAKEAALAAYAAGRAQALAEAKLPPTLRVPEVTRLQDGVVAQFDADIDRLEAGLTEGTPRARGVRQIATEAAVVGVALVLLRRLFAAERYRLELFAEALLWSAWLAGHRAGAIDVVQELARQEGIALGPDAVPGDLPPGAAGEAPRYVWTGPDDEHTCEPCRAQFGEPVIATSLAELPDPQAICAYGRGCRHSWELAGDGA